MTEREIVISRSGRLSISEDGDVLIVRPFGYIGRRMLVRSLEEAEAFGRAHPEGWWHLSATSGVRFVHPANPLYLRRIRRMPNVRGYVVANETWLGRWLTRGIRHFIGSDGIFKTEADALNWIASRR